MATTTATIILSSTDLLSDTLDLNTTATLTGAGNSTGLTLANGLSRKKTGDTNQYTLATASDATFTTDKAHKIYLKNTETDAAKYFLISVGDQELGRLYAGDWALLPWNADVDATPDADIKITPSAASMTLEHMVFIDS